MHFTTALVVLSTLTAPIVALPTTTQAAADVGQSSYTIAL
jgi:hypothetical protein